VNTREISDRLYCLELFNIVEAVINEKSKSNVTNQAICIVDAVAQFILKLDQPTRRPV
jgi:hypothetical protein